jgi:prepilin-type N-terminal cleavage/methylation domain-containing protein
MSKRRPEAGMTMAELMVVLVIIGVVSAAARPMFTRDRIKREGRAFAAQLALDFQRARQQAVAERLPIRAFVFGDRVEFRSAVLGATFANPPRAADLTDPVLRVHTAHPGLQIWAVSSSGTAPGTPVLTSASHERIEWSGLGQARVVGANSTAITLYIRNTNNPAGPERDFRVNVAPLSGAVSMQEGW